MPDLPRDVLYERWSSVSESLIAGCPRCRWASYNETWLNLAAEGKLVCFGCGEPAVIGYDPKTEASFRQERSTPGIHEGVHEKA